LKVDGVYVSNTRETELACGDVGNGALLKAKDATDYIEKCWEYHEKSLYEIQPSKR